MQTQKLEEVNYTQTKLKLLIT